MFQITRLLLVSAGLLGANAGAQSPVALHPLDLAEAVSQLAPTRQVGPLSPGSAAVCLATLKDADGKVWFLLEDGAVHLQYGSASQLTTLWATGELADPQYRATLPKGRLTLELQPAEGVVAEREPRALRASLRHRVVAGAEVSVLTASLVLEDRCTPAVTRSVRRSFWSGVLMLLTR